MIKVLSLFFLFLCTSCDLINNDEGYCEQYTDQDYFSMYEGIKSDVAKKIEKNRKFRCISSGSSGMGMVELLTLSFRFNGSVDIENARKMIIDVAELFLQTINQDKRIRPYLINYPFEPSNISLVIFFKERDGSLPRDLSHVALHRGNVEFCLDPGGTIPIEVLLEETYEEALKIVREENSKIVI